jgi:hypothetical protein
MKRGIIFAVGAAALTLSRLCAAGPSDYVYTPTVEYGEREIDFKAGRANTHDADQNSAASLGFGYGAKPHWFTEFYAKYESQGAGPTHFDAWEWENKFQLTETGEYPVDAGFVVELERPQDHDEGYELRFGPLFETEFGKVQLNGNLLFGRNYRAAVSGPMQFGYQWQAKYRWREAFEFGLQGFADVGPWDNWDPGDRQSHRFGPAVFGKLPVGVHKAIRYNAALLLKASSGAPNTTFRMQVEYEF